MHTLLVVMALAGTRVTDDQGCDKGLDAQNELDGEIICKRNGVKTYEGMYRHGKRVGLAKTWRDDGSLGSVETFVDGQRTGLSEQYDRDGKLEEACELKRDKKDGTCKLYSRGVLREERRYVQGEQRGPWAEYWPNGKVREKGVLDADGKRDGLVERFREDGKPESSRSWVHGKLHGTEKEWHPNGQLESQTEWRDGERDGLIQRWHDNGQLASVSCEKKGKSMSGTNACTGKTGPEVVLTSFPNGKPRTRVTLRDEKRDGVEETFDSNGTLLESVPWANGVRDGVEKVFDRKTGKLKHEQTYRAGKRDGLERTYFDDGKVSEETQWKSEVRGDRTTWWMNGKKKTVDTADGDVSKHLDYDDQGTLVEDVTFKRSRRDGVRRLFFAGSGKPLAEETWVEGTRTARKEWDEKGAVVKDEKYNADGSRQ
ncbi:MAG: toxin-antitoxin system YwqK family antitoxin [Myxococcaceae bacterium]|nr:toxin-antitoxin system YwqK family antitoxin [Myxococcaceae bacterium]